MLPFGFLIPSYLCLTLFLPPISPLFFILFYHFFSLLLSIFSSFSLPLFFRLAFSRTFSFFTLCTSLSPSLSFFLSLFFFLPADNRHFLSFNHLMASFSYYRCQRRKDPPNRFTYNGSKKLNMTSWVREWYLSYYREAEILKMDTLRKLVL